MVLSGPFKYVFIPADEGSPLEEREGDKSGGLSEDVLVKTAREYFFEQTGGAARAKALEEATPEQRQQIAQQIRDQQKDTSPKILELSDDAILDLLRASTSQPSCEIVALTVPTAGNQHRAVSMYTAESSTNLALNPRATALLEACGHTAPTVNNDEATKGVRGDVFVGRCYDFEAQDEWQREDFLTGDADPQADWVQIARTKGGGGGLGAGGQAAHSLSGVMTQMQQQQIQQSSEEDLGYSWEQTKEEVELRFAVASGTKAKYVKVQFGKDRLKVTAAGQVLVQGNTGGAVVVDDCTYTIQDEGKGRELCIVLAKREEGVIWPFAVRKR